ncbi:MAG: acetolactate synthase large subunit, partial [Candidatus Hydrogenedens sp.]|nr:acetolactate synthase large subunit [Candidatus Hydrogenedens sp.]
PLYLGMLGMHGARHTNHILDESDLLIVIGARFDDRATGKVAEFCKHADILHVDIDASEIDKIKKSLISMVADAGLALAGLLEHLEPLARPAWMERIETLRRAHPQLPPAGDDPLLPLNLVRLLGESADGETIVCTDVGQHQMWVAQAYPFRRPRTLLTSGGLGTMGFGLPAAIGAALARPDTPVVCVSGDGSILMNIQELATLAELDLNVKILLMNNAHLGLVRQQQELFYNRRYLASSFQSQPDFAAIARGFGVRGMDLGGAADPEKALRRALAEPGPCLINAPIRQTENVLPMVPPGAANREMIGGVTHAAV